MAAEIPIYLCGSRQSYCMLYGIEAKSEKGRRGQENKIEPKDKQTEETERNYKEMTLRPFVSSEV